MTSSSSRSGADSNGATGKGERLRIAYSPCPNDTFMFHGLVSGLVKLPGPELSVHLHDVEQLNRMALEGAYDVTKVSSYTYLKIRDAYEMLGSGAAMGFGCGPLVVTRSDRRDLDPAQCRFAVPGELTTGYLLLKLWCPHVGKCQFVRYDEVMPMVADGVVDGGVVIHEGRFVYKQAGLRLVQDLGAWWEGRTRLPVPLGCVVAKKNLGRHRIAGIDNALKQSIQAALANPEASRSYVRLHARELDDAVISEHVRTFVNEYSIEQGEAGWSAMDMLEKLAAEAGAL